MSIGLAKHRAKSADRQAFCAPGACCWQQSPWRKFESPSVVTSAHVRAKESGQVVTQCDPDGPRVVRRTSLVARTPHVQRKVLCCSAIGGCGKLLRRLPAPLEGVLPASLQFAKYSASKASSSWPWVEVHYGPFRSESRSRSSWEPRFFKITLAACSNLSTLCPWIGNLAVGQSSTALS